MLKVDNVTFQVGNIKFSNPTKEITIDDPKDLRRRLALIDLARIWPERILVICTDCKQPCSPDKMQIRKAPGKLRHYMGRRCEDCARKTGELANAKEN